MADEPERSGREPNLELPSLLGFGRKKKRKDDAAPERNDPLAADPVPEPAAVSAGDLAPATAKAKRRPPVPPPSAHDGPTPLDPPPKSAETARASDETTVLPSQTAPRPVAPIASAPVESTPVARAEAATATSRRPKLVVPLIKPRIAALVTGATVGLIGVLLAFLTGRGCEAVRGVGSCGGVGLFALLVILAIQVVLGAILLKVWRLADPTTTSFLGVGLMAVFVLFFLLSSVSSDWMLLVLPVLTALTYVLSLWVTDTLVDTPGQDTMLR